MEFPEMGRAAPVELIVSVVIRPDTVTGRFQNVAIEDIESESNQDIEILGPNFLHRIWGEAMHALLSRRFHLDGLDSGEQIPAIDLGDRVICWLHLRVEAKVKVVKQALSQFRIR